MCFQGLADYLLECCSAQAKANTLSLFSFLPILLTSIFISGPSRLWFILSCVSLLLHQILDIANKKQAYRLQSFSFGTYYFDHMCDTFSAMLIVYIMGTLFQVPHNWLWLCVFLFAILPFYIHHLTMYYNEYMCFPTISPATEGKLFTIQDCFYWKFCVLQGLFRQECMPSRWVDPNGSVLLRLSCVLLCSGSSCLLFWILGTFSKLVLNLTSSLPSRTCSSFL